MKKILLLISVAVLLASCASTTNDVESKRQELQDLKQQMHELKGRIETLENELAENTDKDVVSVTITPLENQLFEHFIEVTGYVEAEQDVNVSPESAGIIESILIKEGDIVSKGQVLGTINNDALKQSLDELQIQFELATTTYNRQKNLWDQNIGSELQFLQAKANMESLQKRIEGLKAQLDMAVIKSPLDGVIDVLYQKKGQIGSPQVPFAKVLNIDKVKIYADVAETYITKINRNDKVKVYFPSLNRETAATIDRIGNTIDPNNRTLPVRINLDNRDKMIKPNMVSIIKIRDYFNENAIVVSSLLIKEDFRGNYTYVTDLQNGKNVAKKVYVIPGVTNNNMTEITEGLASGMIILSEGFNQVADGTEIKF